MASKLAASLIAQIVSGISFEAPKPATVSSNSMPFSGLPGQLPAREEIKEAARALDRELAMEHAEALASSEGFRSEIASIDGLTADEIAKRVERAAPLLKPAQNTAPEIRIGQDERGDYVVQSPYKPRAVAAFRALRRRFFRGSWRATINGEIVSLPNVWVIKPECRDDLWDLLRKHYNGCTVQVHTGAIFTVGEGTARAA